MKNVKSGYGFTFLELLIGLMLSAILVAGIVSIFSSLSKGYDLRDAMSRVQEDGRLGLELMSREIRKAGYRVFPRSADMEIVYAQLDNAFTASDDIPTSAVIWGINGLPDTFFIRYEVGEDSDLTESLCFGGTTAASSLSPAIVYSGNYAVITQKFYIENNELKCDSRLDYNSNTQVAQKNAYTLVENVETLRVLYGVNTDPISADPSVYDQYLANKYVDAATVTNWANVRSIRFSLVMRSEADYVASNATSTISLNGGKVINIDSADQKRMFRDFNTTVMLRNAILNEELAL